MEKAELCTDVTVQNSHTQPMKCHKQVHSEAGISLEEGVQMHLRVGEVIVWATALKLILEVSGSKMSRTKGFSLDSPHGLFLL